MNSKVYCDMFPRWNLTMQGSRVSVEKPVFTNNPSKSSHISHADQVNTRRSDTPLHPSGKRSIPQVIPRSLNQAQRSRSISPARPRTHSLSPRPHIRPRAPEPAYRSPIADHPAAPQVTSNIRRPWDSSASTPSEDRTSMQ